MNNEINKIIDVLSKGEIAILPTDTVYGLTGDATSLKAIKLANDIKKREKPQPLLILVSSIEMLKKYTKNISDLELEIINKYWPNKLTILFEKNELLSDELTASSPYVGVRMPNNKLLLDIMNKYNKPLLSTSANIHSKDVITKISLLESEMKESVSYIYDAGELSTTASTLIKVENGKIKILREGELTSQIINDFKSVIEK
jgi:L-threonylcarbamoyladenylate synthase